MSREVERRKPHAFDALDFAYPMPPGPAITREDFGRGIAALAAAQPWRTLPPATAELYYRALARYQAADFGAAVRVAVDTCEQFPSIATLRRLCDEARTARREREGKVNAPGQPVSAERAALVAELHEAAADVLRLGAAEHQHMAHAAIVRHARAVEALRELP